MSHIPVTSVFQRFLPRLGRGESLRCLRDLGLSLVMLLSPAECLRACAPSDVTGSDCFERVLRFGIAPCARCRCNSLSETTASSSLPCVVVVVHDADAVAPPSPESVAVAGFGDFDLSSLAASSRNVPQFTLTSQQAFTVMKYELLQEPSSLAVLALLFLLHSSVDVESTATNGRFHEKWKLDLTS